VRLVGLHRVASFGSRGTVLLEAADAFVVALAARRSWFRYRQLFAVLLRLERRLPGWLTWPRWAGRFLGRPLAGAEAPGRSPWCWPPAGPGLVGRWGQADRPCGICGLLSLWPLGRCRTERVIPSVGGVPELPALPTALLSRRDIT